MATWSLYRTLDRSAGRLANHSGSGRGSRRVRSTIAATPAIPSNIETTHGQRLLERWVIASFTSVSLS